MLTTTKNECFKRYAFHDIAGNPRGTNVLQILQTADSAYWMVDNQGFSSIDIKTGVVHDLPLPETQKNDLIRIAMKCQTDGRIWLGGQNGGIYYCDPPYREISFFVRTRSENVNAILPDGDHIWIGYFWGGVDKMTKGGVFGRTLQRQ